MVFGEKLLAILLVGLMAVGGAVTGLMDDEEPEEDTEAPDSRILPISGLFYIKTPVEPMKNAPDGVKVYEAGNVKQALNDATPYGLGNDGVIVRWAGEDGREGSGIASYDVQVRNGMDGEWQYLRMGTTDNQAMFYPTDEGQYYFRCQATDKAGNVEEWPVIADAGFTVKIIDLEDRELPGIGEGPSLPFE